MIDIDHEMSALTLYNVCIANQQGYQFLQGFSELKTSSQNFY